MSDREPLFNAPGVILGLIAAFAAVHAFRHLALDARGDVDMLLAFAFIPARFDASPGAAWAFPGQPFSDAWVFVTYAFLHGDLAHLAVNSIWLLVFGSAVARRFGVWRTLAFFAVTAAAGAVAHLASVGYEAVPMVGASAAVSGMTAAAFRFIFQSGGPLGAFRQDDEGAYRTPAIGLLAMARNPTLLLVVGVWMGMNVAFGAVSLPFAGAEGAIAWQAHIGGFLAGLFLFRLFDPVG